MCGIAGFVELSGASPDPARLRRMTDCIAHRGPDHTGAFIWKNAALGHRRLSIVDVSPRGNQPMCDVEASPSVWIVYNGEVYNHPQIRDTLQSTEPYRGTSDTEVLLRAYRDRGPGCFNEINGIFAFGVLDTRSEELVLVRDQFGIKPMYYAVDKDRFYFASELKAMIAAGFRPEAEPIAALDFVFTGWTSDSRTMLKGVRRLPPGCWLTLNLRTGEIRVQRYYEPHPDWDSTAHLGDSEEAWQAHIARMLESSVRGQLMSDVPVGTFCSGGLDSSLVTAMAARHKKDILAFNVACPDTPDLDEGGYARRVAEHVGIKLHTYNLDRQSFREALVQAVSITEYPLSFVNTVPLYLLSKLAREQGVKVLLSGEGADETFGGYLGEYRAIALRRVVRSKGALGEALLGRGVDLATMAGAKVGMQSANSRAAGMHNVLTGGLRNWAIHQEALATYERFRDPVDRELAAEFLTQLRSYLLPILHRTDRASMAASVEARVPFLDPRLVGAALAIPPSLKVGVNGLRPVPKKILKSIAESWLPKSIIYRSKMGFMVPPSYYLGPWPKSWLHEGFVVEQFGLEPCALKKWLGVEDGQTACWMLTLEIWGQIFIRGRSPADVNGEYLVS
jgi:asparagine synthase (glutamine-hydrolysing)